MSSMKLFTLLSGGDIRRVLLTSGRSHRTLLPYFLSNCVTRAGSTCLFLYSVFVFTSLSLSLSG